jgi:hypothetical protein
MVRTDAAIMPSPEMKLRRRGAVHPPKVSDLGVGFSMDSLLLLFRRFT